MNVNKVNLLINQISDTYIQENFKRLAKFLNNVKVKENINYSDTNRPTTNLKAGDQIFNTDDGQLNIWDGTQWTLPDGTPT